MIPNHGSSNGSNKRKTMPLPIGRKPVATLKRGVSANAIPIRNHHHPSHGNTSHSNHRPPPAPSRNLPKTMNTHSMPTTHSNNHFHSNSSGTALSAHAQRLNTITMVDYDDSDSQSDLDSYTLSNLNHHGTKYLNNMNAASSNSTASSFDGHRDGDSGAEWVECKESVSGRTIWYNRDTLMVTFEDPLSRTAGSRVRGASILKESIAREDLEVEAIPEALLRFGSQRWDFNNDHVAVFRAQSSRIDHRQLLPNADDVVFPEFFSNHTIPRKEVFVARILPPIEFEITSTSWKMAVDISKTTASDVICKFVTKINFGKSSSDRYSPKEFVLKVIGNEEYILFNDKQLIIDYEAVRRAVRNEDDVTFGLRHQPDLDDIIESARSQQEVYKESFGDKYPRRVRDPQFLHYEQHGAGDGKSLIELKLQQMQRQKDEEYRRKHQKHRRSQQHQLNLRYTSFPETNEVPDHPQHHSPPQRLKHGHTMSHSADIETILNSETEAVLPRAKTQRMPRTSNSRPPTPPSPIKESVTNDAIFPALPAMVLSNSAGSTITHHQSIHSHSQRAPRRSMKRNPPKPPPKRNLPNLAVDLKVVQNTSSSKSSPNLDIDHGHSSHDMMHSNGSTKLIKSLSADHHLSDGDKSPTSPHRMSVSEHRRLHRSTNSFSAAMKLGQHDSSRSRVSPYGEEPSLRDSKWLRDELKSRNQAGDHGAVLLQDHDHSYRLRIAALINVTKLPRFVDQKSRIRRIVVRHELWMGPLSWPEVSHSTPNIASVSDAMQFADWFTAPTLKYCDLPREATISLTVYGLSEHEKRRNEVVETPLGFVRLPLIDHRHRLISGKFVLNVWPIPVFVKTKHGLKSDPYSHGEEFRFRGPTRDRFIVRQNGTETKLNQQTQSQNRKTRIIDEINDNNVHHDLCQIEIEFTRRDFDVVAPLISIGQTAATPHSKNIDRRHWWRDQREREKLRKKNGKIHHDDGDSKSNSREPSYSDSNGSSPSMLSSRSNNNNNKRSHKRKRKGNKEESTEGKFSSSEWKTIHDVITRDLISEITDEEKDLMWAARDELVSMPSALPTFLKCVDWRDQYFRAETYQYLRRWQPPSFLEDALELLSYELMDTRVREYGVLCIANMHDSDLQRYLLQLVQCLKFEAQHNNALIRLLMRRALQNPYQIGHFLFWHLMSEYEQLESTERFGLYLEEYLLHSPSHSRELLQQCNLMDALKYINGEIRRGRRQKMGKEQLMTSLHGMIEELNRAMPTTFSLPLNPRWRCTHLVTKKCKFFGSAQVPLCLVFKNIDPLADDISVIFKSGDDLRQDILTLQVFRVMDKVWLDRGLNLRLITYDVVATGNDCGMIEIVTSATTTNDIHVEYGGGPNKGPRDERTHYQYLHHHNINEKRLDTARYNYARSAAGYAVATYVLGIGDRHPDNIMLRENGVLFHIDFGHFLGNFKVKKVVASYSWKRERSPFVMLPAMKYVMDKGGKDKQLYLEFQQWFEDAFMALRIRHRLLFNLFCLMIPSVMPELICKEDLMYLKEQLHLTDIPQERIGRHCKKVIKQCLTDKSRILDNIFHAVKHSS